MLTICEAITRQRSGCWCRGFNDCPIRQGHDHTIISSRAHRRDNFIKVTAREAKADHEAEERAEEALEVQVQRTERAKEDALVNKWYRFLNDAQLSICERGNRKKLGQCRETVTMEGEDFDAYPEYYLQNFHFQKDGEWWW